MARQAQLRPLPGPAVIQTYYSGYYAKLAGSKHDYAS
jgi:hypothetical protein